MSENSPVDQIAAAYQRKLQEHAPDRVAWMGHDVVELARVRTRRIEAAYAQAMRLRGSSIEV